MLICRWLVYFVIYSFLGWVYETIVCTIRWKRWENRGFLYGPICPIYGTGAVGSMIVMEIVNSHGLTYEWWEVFLYSMLASIVLEYSTHWLLETFFHAKWWDYSYMPLNIKGRVCLPFSLGFGLAGIVIVYVLNPWVYKITDWISPTGFEVMGLIIMGVIGMDIALTASALAHFDVYIRDSQDAINAHMKEFVDGMGERSAQMKLRITEEREKFSVENISAKVSSMTPLAKQAVARMVGYTGRGGSFKINRNRIAEFLKEHKPDFMSDKDKEKEASDKEGRGKESA